MRCCIVLRHGQLLKRLATVLHHNGHIGGRAAHLQVIDVTGGVMNTKALPVDSWVPSLHSGSPTGLFVIEVGQHGTVCTSDSITSTRFGEQLLLHINDWASMMRVATMASACRHLQLIIPRHK